MSEGLESLQRVLEGKEEPFAGLSSAFADSTPYFEREARIAERKEALCDAAKKWEEARDLFYGYADMHTGEVAKTLENAFDNAEDALIAAVDALIKAEGAG